MPPAYKKRAYRKKRAAPKRRRVNRRRTGSKAPRQVATITEAYQVSAPDGLVVFNRQVQLSSATFDRAQTVAQAYQEYCIKKITMIFRPSADTFTPAAGNSMPNLYFVMDKAVSIPTNAQLQTLLDMGVKPVRFDDKNIRRAYKPVALLANDTSTVGTLAAGQLSKPSPWLATNANAGAPSASWAASAVEHTGCAFFVTKMSGLTPTIAYTVDISVDFAFRKPTWRVPAQSEGLIHTPNVNLIGDQLINA